MKETEAFVRYEKRTRIMNLVFKIGSIVLLATSLILAILNLTLRLDPTLDIVVLVLLLVYFVVMLPMLMVTTRRRTNVVLYRSYSRVLARNPHNSVGEISASCGMRPEKIVDDFMRLNALGFFEGMTIDKAACKVDLDTGETTGAEFVCPMCGGKTVLSEGQEHKCAFCGAVLQNPDEGERKEDPNGI